jgi:hypothetical protein
MHKTDQSLRKICVAAINRHFLKGSPCQWTKLYDREQMEDLGAFHLHFSYDPNELPIASVIVSAQNWVIVTTRQVVGKFEDNTQIVPIERVRTWNWGDFKGMKAQPFEQIYLEAEDGIRYPFRIETGPTAMILLYAILTLVRISPSQ